MRASHLLPLAFLLLIIGCDKIDMPDNPKPTTAGCTGNGYGFRRVLLEEYTGFRCTNCPVAAETAHELDDFYCGDLIIVGMHVSASFAAPTATPPDPFSTDFRTAAGETYLATFPPSGLPNGLVSRRTYNSSHVVPPGSWGSATSEILGQPAQFEVVFETVQYTSGTELVDLTIKVPVLRDTTGDFNLTIYLIEDHVPEGQLDARVTPPEVFPYDHRQVLRDNINGTWGQSIFTGSASIGDTATVTASYTLPAPVLEPANCYLVVYVYRVDNNEIMQVSERKLIP